MSETTGQEAPAVASETPNPAAATAPADTQVVDTQTTAPEEEPAVEKTYSKAELQELVEKATAKAAAKAERRAYREALETLRPQQQEAARQQSNDPPPRRENETDAQYVDRLVDQRLAQREQAGTQKAFETKTEKLYAEASKLTGFDRDEFNDLLTSHPFSAEFSHALVGSDQAAQLMAYMTANPEEAVRISALSPVRQAAEIGKWEVKLTTAPKTSRAPAPISPIGSRGSAANSADLANLPMEQYIEARKKQGARWAR